MRERLAKTKKQIAKQANKYRKDVSFNVGNEVYLNTKNIKSMRPLPKLDYKYIGLYKVKAIVNYVTYTLDLPSSLSIYPTFYVLLLKKSILDYSSRKQDKIKQYDVGDKDEQEVEDILDKKEDDLYNFSYLIK